MALRGGGDVTAKLDQSGHGRKPLREIPPGRFKRVCRCASPMIDRTRSGAVLALDRPLRSVAPPRMQVRDAQISYACLASGPGQSGRVHRPCPRWPADGAVIQVSADTAEESDSRAIRPSATAFSQVGVWGPSGRFAVGLRADRPLAA